MAVVTCIFYAFSSQEIVSHSPQLSLFSSVKLANCVEEKKNPTRENYQRDLKEFGIAPPDGKHVYVRNF